MVFRQAAAVPLLAALSFAGSSSARAAAPGPPAQIASADTAASSDGPALGTVVPPGLQLRFHVDGRLSSADSKTGQTFTFTLVDPAISGGVVVAPPGARGAGTVMLAGRAGTSGHEGDLTLRIDSIATANGHRLTCGERVEINGANRKVLAGLLGIVPFAGAGARFIRGGESVISPATVVLVVTKHAATVTPVEATTEPVRHAPTNAAP